MYKTWGFPSQFINQSRGYGHTTRAPPGVSLPSGSRTRNLQILDPAFKPLIYLGCYIIGRDCGITVVISQLWYHSCLPISKSHVISYTKYHMWYWMSKVNLSTPLSKQLNLALHSRLFRQAEVFLRLVEEETETILMSSAEDTGGESLM